MAMIHVKPASGGRVRMPERGSRVMPPEGAWVPRVDYYERLLICGDLTICDPPSPSKPEPAKKQTATKEESQQGGPT
jgi:hypothetical protein